jgi:predicted PurR-regulated permease PerM
MTTHPTDTPADQRQRRWIITGILTAIILLFAGLGVLLIQDQTSQIQDLHTQLDQLRSQVDQACAGTIATLDLTEWVQVCRTVHPEDLDRW